MSQSDYTSPPPKQAIELGWIVMTPAEVFDTIGATLGHTCLAVYMKLDRHANADRISSVTEENIAIGLKLSTRWVRDAINKLEEAKWITVTHHKNAYGYQAANTYFIPEHWCGSATGTTTGSTTGSKIENTSAIKNGVNQIHNHIQPDTTISVLRPKTNYPPDFESFWSVYPKGHGSKKAALDEWDKIKPDEPTKAEIIASVHKWAASNRWRDGFIKDAERFLKLDMWRNPPDPEESQPKSRENSITDDGVRRIMEQRAMDRAARAGGGS